MPDYRPGPLLVNEEMTLHVVQGARGAEDGDVTVIRLEFKSGSAYLIGTYEIDEQDIDEQATAIGNCVRHEVARRVRATFAKTIERRRNDELVGKLKR